jgi:hypothetical protein
MNDSKQQIIENQKEIIRNQELMLHNEGFWEHFTDHLIIAFSFSCLGFLACSYLILYLYKQKVRIDYDVEEGTIMRVVKNNGKKMLIIRPGNIAQLYDVILLSFFDKGKEKFVCKQSTKRIRMIRNVLLILTVVFGLSGIILVLSAVDMDINIFDYIFK